MVLKAKGRSRFPATETKAQPTGNSPRKLSPKPARLSTFEGSSSPRKTAVELPSISALAAGLPEAVTLEPAFGTRSGSPATINLRAEVQRLHESGELIVGGITGSYDPLGRLVAFDAVDGLRISAEAMSRVGSAGGGPELEQALVRALHIRQRLTATLQQPTSATRLWTTLIEREVEADQLLEARAGIQRRAPASDLTGTA